MPYDEHLADRIREALKRTPSVTERKMFGGLCFFVDDKMCINIGRKAGWMQRCLPEKTEDLATRDGVTRYVMKGKPLSEGWLWVSDEAIDADDDHSFWISIALEGNKAALPKNRKG